MMVSDDTIVSTKHWLQSRATPSEHSCSSMSSQMGEEAHSPKGATIVEPLVSDTVLPIRIEQPMLPSTGNFVCFWGCLFQSVFDVVVYSNRRDWVGTRAIEVSSAIDTIDWYMLH